MKIEEIEKMFCFNDELKIKEVKKGEEDFCGKATFLVRNADSALHTEFLKDII